jgi:hypothetical protein
MHRLRHKQENSAVHKSAAQYFKNIGTIENAVASEFSVAFPDVQLHLEFSRYTHNLGVCPNCSNIGLRVPGQVFSVYLNVVGFRYHFDRIYTYLTWPSGVLNVNVSVHSVSYLIVIDSGIHTIALIGGI